VYNLSIQSQINEQEFDRHLEMNFVDFLEALARIADFLNPLPFIEINEVPKLKSLSEEEKNIYLNEIK
jgi:hypothetical protein